MTSQDRLYLDDSYLKEFDAVVEEVRKDEEGVWIRLDKTAFYPTGGGQPHDTGKLIHDGSEFTITDVKKANASVWHKVEQGPAGRTQEIGIGSNVRGVIDWERRYRLMRMHTAAHIVSSVAHQEYGAQISGNQLDTNKTRVDFSLEEFDRTLLLGLQQKANDIIAKDLQISKKTLPREEAFKIPALVKLEKGLDPAIQEVRIVSIGDFDMSEIAQRGSETLIQAISEHAQKYASRDIAAFFDAQADGGTHVAHTAEIKGIEVFDLENKGKGRKRMYFRLVD